jgi:hypothetical protein
MEGGQVKERLISACPDIDYRDICPQTYSFRGK